MKSVRSSLRADELISTPLPRIGTFFGSLRRLRIAQGGHFRSSLCGHSMRYILLRPCSPVQPVSSLSSPWTNTSAITPWRWAFPSVPNKNNCDTTQGNLDSTDETGTTKRSVSFATTIVGLTLEPHLGFGHREEKLTTVADYAD